MTTDITIVAAAVLSQMFAWCPGEPVRGVKGEARLLVYSSELHDLGEVFSTARPGRLTSCRHADLTTALYNTTLYVVPHHTRCSVHSPVHAETEKFQSHSALSAVKIHSALTQ